MNHSLRGSCAVAGIGLTDFGDLPGRSALENTAEAVHSALTDAGIHKSEVDALFTSNFPDTFAALHLAEYLGVQPHVLDDTNIGGAVYVSQLQHAAAAIQAGLCNVAVIAMGSNTRSKLKQQGIIDGPRELFPYEDEYRPKAPMNAYALAAARHMHQYGTTREHLAEIAVAARAWAQLNPRAIRRTPLSIAEVMAAPMVCDPLSAMDCCLIADAGAAVVLVSADRARDLPQSPVYLLGVGVATTHAGISQMPDLTVTASVESGKRAYDMAGLSAREVDVVSLYDAFTINTLLFLEDLGFCPKGEGGNFVSDGNIAPGGGLPVNTNGGGLSCVHPGMYGLMLIIEAVEQLRHAAGERQIPGAEIALCNGNGGHLSSQATAIFGTSSSL
ncbi:thiolase [Aestuariicella hydrocarbonica]|uniref:Thiolase n=1 Tax=Pseudomaricurvus hydrocarbonicus TaxID=1470433 RepID=A0A9E5JVQ8_9GAMM|nr:acetyl-CoA acetyltransferase [Aestuariicella hydrocarbonica]NHO66124.1 thiolase [Aestuariicella hydrocarbonica]